MMEYEYTTSKPSNNPRTRSLQFALNHHNTVTLKHCAWLGDTSVSFLIWSWRPSLSWIMDEVISLNSMLKQAEPWFVCKAPTTQHLEITWCYRSNCYHRSKLKLYWFQKTWPGKKYFLNQTKLFCNPYYLLSSGQWESNVFSLLEQGLYMCTGTLIPFAPKQR